MPDINYTLKPGEDINAYYQRTQGQTQKQALASPDISNTQTNATPPITPDPSTTSSIPSKTPSQTGMDDTSFLGVLNNLQVGLKQNNALVDQKNAIQKQMFDRPLTSDEVSKLPPDIQKIIQGGNREQMALQLQVINDSLQGRNNSVASSIQFLTTGYEQAQTRYNQDVTNVLNYSKALNAKPSDVMKALYPAEAARLGTQLDKLAAPLLTSTQVPNIQGGDFSVMYGPTAHIASTNHNPFDIKDPKTGKFISYPSDAVGVQAGLQLIQEYQNGGITVPVPDGPNIGKPITSQSSIEDMARVYAPTSDGNNPLTWATNVANSIGVQISTPIGQIDPNQLASAVAQAESGSVISSAGTNPIVQAYVDGIKSGTIPSIAQVPAAYKSLVAVAMDKQNIQSPLGDRRFVMAANGIVANYIALPGYALTANGLPYLQRIAAAEANPGSVSDQDLLDSLTKLNTSGNAITDAQVSLITGGRSFADSVAVWGNKLTTGGVLSPDQRQQIQKIANSIYANYAKGYQPIYDQVTKQLTEAQIPQQFWTIPDLNALAKASGLSIPGVTDSGTSTDLPSQVKSKGYDYNKMKSDGYSDDDIKKAIGL